MMASIWGALIMTDKRKRDLSAIHASKNKLGIDDDTYRQMLRAVAGKDSAGKMNQAERTKVLRHLKQLGGGKPQQKKAEYPGKPHNLNNEPMLQKIEAQLADMKLPWSYADAIAQRMFKIDKVAWLKTTKQLSAVITALSKEQEKCEEAEQ